MPVLYDVARNWWALAVRGILAVLFGILLFSLPGLTLEAVLLVYGVFTFIHGIFGLSIGLSGQDDARPGWAWIVGGVISIFAGCFAMFWPDLALTAFLYLVAGWAVLMGVLEIGAAVGLRHQLRREWLMATGGVASVVFGVLLALQPGVGLITLALLIGGYALVWGVVELTVAVRLRQVARRAELAQQAEGPENPERPAEAA